MLRLPKAPEACPHGLAPTTSTLMQLAIGDALAVALLEARGFTPGDYHQFHPGGRLGANLTHIGEIMHKGERFPGQCRDRHERGDHGSRQKALAVWASSKMRVGWRASSPTATCARNRRDHVEARRGNHDAQPKTVNADTLVAKALDLVNSIGHHRADGRRGRQAGGDRAFARSAAGGGGLGGAACLTPSAPHSIRCPWKPPSPWSPPAGPVRSRAISCRRADAAAAFLDGFGQRRGAADELLAALVEERLIAAPSLFAMTRLPT